MPGEKSRTAEWAEVEAAAPEVVVSMPCGYYAEQAAAETDALAATTSTCWARGWWRVDAAAYFSRPGPAPGRGRRAARPPAPPRASAGAALAALDRAGPQKGSPAGGSSVSEPATAAAPSATQTSIAAASGIRVRCAQLDEHERAQRAADEPADVPAPGDVEPWEERDDQVQDDPEAEAALQDVEPAVPHHDRGGAHQPEHRARGAHRRAHVLLQQRAERAGQQRDEVDHREARSADGRLQQRAEDVQAEHVEQQVRQPVVEEARGDEAPVLAVLRSRRATGRPRRTGCPTRRSRRR